MGAAHKLFDKKVLRDLVPLNALSPMHVEEVAKKATVEELRPGRYIFKQGDRDNQSIYVLDGEVSIIGDDKEVLGSVVGGADSARHPIGHQQPRQVSARAKTNVVVARIDSSLLDVLLTWDESSGYEVVEIEDGEEDDDWMTKMLQSPAFMQLPPANIQQLLMKMESVPVKAGDLVVRQGDDGDYFYVVTSGRCVVTRKASAHGKEVKLAELDDGASFGEDALVSDNKRNATITMLTDGTLMRLAKGDFQQLLQAPLVHQVDFQQAAKLAGEGAQWLDVRLPGEFENGAPPGARNIPLSGLRDPSTEFAEDAKFILCCDTGRRSASGAFVLSQRGMDVYVLDGGLQSVPATELVKADGSPATAAPAPAAKQQAEVIPLEAAAPAAAQPEVAPQAEPAADAAADELSELKARQEKETARFKEFQESAKHKIQAAQEAQRTAEERATALDEEVRSTQAALEQARGDGGADGKRIQDLEAQLEKAVGAQTQMRDELEESHERLTSSEQQVQALEQKLTEEHKARESQLKEAHAELDASQQQIASLEQQREQLEADQKSLQADLEAAKGDTDTALKQLTQERDELRQQWDQAREQAERLGAQSKQLEQDHASAAQRLEQAEAALQAAQQSSQEQETAAQQRRDELEAQAQQLQDDHQAQTEQVTSLGAERDDLQAQLEGLRQQQQAEQERLQADVEENSQQADAVRAELDAERSQRQQEQQRIGELEQQIEAAAAQRTDLEEQLQSGGAATQALTAELTTARAELSELQTQLEQQRQQADTAKIKAEEQVQSAQQALGAEKETLQQELEQLRANLEEQQSGLAASTAEQQLLVQQKTDAEATLEALNAEREQLETELRQELTALEQRMQQSQTECEAAQTELTTARQQGEELQTRLAAAQGDEAGKVAEQQRLQAALDEAQAELVRLGETAEQQQSSLRGELDAAQQTQAQLEEALEQLRGEQAQQRDVGAADSAEQEALRLELTEQQQLVEELRGELAELSEGRDQAQVTTEGQLHELRCSLEASEQQLERLRQERDQLLASSDLSSEVEQHMQELEEQLSGLEQALAEARGEAEELRSRETAMRADMDSLRAEAEVAQGLAELHAGGAEASGASTEQLQRELAEAKQNVQIAVRLRTEAEEARTQVEQKLVLVQQELVARRADDALQTATLNVPSLDDEDEVVGVAASPEPVAAAPQVAPEPAPVATVPAPEPAPARKGGLWLGAVMGLVLGAAAAGGVFMALQPAGAPPAPGTVATPPPAAEAQPAPKLLAPEPKAAPKLAPKPKSEPKAVAKPKPETKPKPIAKPAPEPFGKTFSDRLRDGSRGPALVEIRTASFDMGSSASSPKFDERPRREIKLGAFAVAKTEVSFAQYDRFARATGRDLPDDDGWGRDERPVINVSWEDANAYTQWLAEQTGHRYRLPSEAEWEYVARGGVQERYWWGNKLGQQQANCFGCGSQWDGRSSAPVGSFAANPFGIHDSAGNVQEWVQDCYRNSYQGAPTDGSAVEFDGCGQRVVRGGGFTSAADRLRSAGRGQLDPGSRLNDVGFRVVRTR